MPRRPAQPPLQNAPSRRGGRLLALAAIGLLVAASLLAPVGAPSVRTGRSSATVVPPDAASTPGDEIEAYFANLPPGRLRPRTPRSPLARSRRAVGRLWSRLPYAVQPARLRNRDNWSIGLYGGDDLMRLGPLRGVRNPILTRRSVTDVDAAFVADPFLFEWDGRWYLFCEVFNWDTGLGEIAVATSDDARRWRYGGVVIIEPYHLSYPFPLAIEGVPHLVVESSAADLVRAYRATDFPYRWEPAADLLTDGERVDPTLLQHDDRWWLFTGRYSNGAWRALDLHVAPHPLGPFEAHPANPVVADDPRLARPGGRIVRDGSRLIRFGQDCSAVYGERLWAAEIEAITPHAYAERPLLERPFLVARGRGWNRARMHHIDAHRLDDGSWLAAVDGW